MASMKEIVDLIFEADADKDGYLTRQEIVNYLSTGVSKRQIDNFIQVCDKNGDGKVTREELTRILEKMIV